MKSTNSNSDSNSNSKFSDRAAGSAVRPDLNLLDARLPSHDDQARTSKRLNVDVPTNFYAQVQRFVDDGTYDFENMGAFVRWSMLFSMDYLERLEPPPYRSNIQIWKAIAAELSESETRRGYLHYIERSSQEVFELLGLSLHDEAETLVAKVLSHIRQLSKKSAWRQLYESTFKIRFGHVLKTGKITELTSVSYDDNEPDE